MKNKFRILIIAISAMLVMVALACGALLRDLGWQVNHNVSSASGDVKG